MDAETTVNADSTAYAADASAPGTDGAAEVTTAGTARLAGAPAPGLSRPAAPSPGVLAVSQPPTIYDVARAA
ncbi:MAG TPA: hypothetical protein VGD68_04520, partial [Streptosporangiaceae bacterium]